MKIMGLWASNSTAMKRTGVLAANKTYTVYSSRARSFRIKTSNTFGNTSEVQLICCFPVNTIFFFSNFLLSLKINCAVSVTETQTKTFHNLFLWQFWGWGALILHNYALCLLS